MIKRASLVLAAALLVSASSGCQCMRAFLYDTYDCMCGGFCADTCCSNCSGCGDCDAGGCSGCDGCGTAGCSGCGGLGAGGCLGCGDGSSGNVAGAGSVTYPYYTVRGPRDFLARSPRPIGR